MTRYMVGYINFFNNELIVELVEGNTWKEALSKHSSLKDENGNPDDLAWLAEDLKEAKEEAYNADFAFDVKEVY